MLRECVWALLSVSIDVVPVLAEVLDVTFVTGTAARQFDRLVSPRCPLSIEEVRRTNGVLMLVVLEHLHVDVVVSRLPPADCLCVPLVVLVVLVILRVRVVASLILLARGPLGCGRHELALLLPWAHFHLGSHLPRGRDAVLLVLQIVLDLVAQGRPVVVQGLVHFGADCVVTGEGFHVLSCRDYLSSFFHGVRGLLGQGCWLDLERLQLRLWRSLRVLHQAELLRRSQEEMDLSAELVRLLVLEPGVFVHLLADP